MSPTYPFCNLDAVRAMTDVATLIYYLGLAALMLR